MLSSVFIKMLTIGLLRTRLKGHFPMVESFKVKRKALQDCQTVYPSPIAV